MARTDREDVKTLSIVTPCYNEVENLRELHARITAAMAQLSGYDYEIIVVDNASTDGSVELLRELCAADKHLKAIVNNRNFGHIRSPYHGMLQASGACIIYLASDLQDPPEMIPEFVRLWEEGNEVVLAQKTNTSEAFTFKMVRHAYYHLIGRLSDVELVKNATGFGLYDRRVIDAIRDIGDPYPYFRGLICELGYKRALVPFTQPQRKRGFTKNNFYTLYDNAMLGITSHSKIPLRLATLTGFVLGAISFVIAAAYLVYKLLYWKSFELGLAPVLIGIFFFGAVQLFFTGIIGEYLGAIHTHILNHPPVIERERINFPKK